LVVAVVAVMDMTLVAVVAVGLVWFLLEHYQSLLVHNILSQWDRVVLVGPMQKAHKMVQQAITQCLLL
jgi:hypothetical protein